MSKFALWGYRYSSISEEKNLVAVFTSKNKLDNYIAKSKLKSGKGFKQKSLLSSYNDYSWDVWVEEPIIDPELD